MPRPGSRRLPSSTSGTGELRSGRRRAVRSRPHRIVGRGDHRLQRAALPWRRLEARGAGGPRSSGDVPGYRRCCRARGAGERRSASRMVFRRAVTRGGRQPSSWVQMAMTARSHPRFATARAAPSSRSAELERCSTERDEHTAARRRKRGGGSSDSLAFEGAQPSAQPGEGRSAGSTPAPPPGQGTIASASISTSSAGSTSLLTSTIVVTGRTEPKTSPWTRPTSSHRSMSVT